MRIVFALGLCFLTSSIFAQTKKPAPKPVAGPGQQVYEQYCLSCHQVDGSGVPNLNPPLKQSEWVTGDKTRLINVILKGLQEPIEINGETFDNVMPAHDFLSDKEISDVLTFIRSSFGNKAEAVSAEDVKKVRAVK
ncbi:c-type cytochrome [Larkinella terrae]|uniref:C-type cytochrome n=1 Tax=Larkinella terrae TaxID=2025311 RepID=A0A7K0ESB1_9BACT|nr:cytochrome c [Larkinella terrae]MRS64703.1 c-type cytochrome [Larkinella terrae]